jgi:hypothetical protein
MPVDRKIFKTPTSVSNPSQWPCPTCSKGVLKTQKTHSRIEEIKKSKNMHNHPDWEPEWITLTISAMHECTNPECKEKVAYIGVGQPVENQGFDSDGTPYLNHENEYVPKFFFPHLNIFQIPPNTPIEIKSEIEKSFSLFFASPSATSNHTRRAIELLLTHLKVKRYGTTKKKKRYIIPLHQRIELLPKKLHNLEDLFMAIKWLGNAGSHPSKISIDDVMDSYDILEEIFKELFEKRRKRVKNLAKKINKKKGPSKK